MNAAIYNREQLFPFKQADGVVPQQLKTEYAWWPEDVPYKASKDLTLEQSRTIFEACIKHGERMRARLCLSRAMSDERRAKALACIDCVSPASGTSSLSIDLCVCQSYSQATPCPAAEQAATCFEGAVLKLNGHTTAAAIVKCFRHSKSHETVCRRNAVVKRGQYTLPLHELYNAVLDNGGYSLVRVPPFTLLPSSL